jgi:hypothetical protein
VARPNQVAQRLVQRVGDPDVAQLAGAVQARQGDGVTPVILDALPRFAGCQRGRTDAAVQSHACKLPLHVVAARSCFVDELDHAVPTRETTRQLPDRRRRVLDRAEVPDLAASAGNGDRDRGLVHIEANKSANLFHDSISWLPEPTPGRARTCCIEGREGHVIWPSPAHGRVSVTSAQLSMLLDDPERCPGC